MALARTLDIPLWTGDGQFYRAVQDDPLVWWIGEVTTCPSGGAVGCFWKRGWPPRAVGPGSTYTHCEEEGHPVSLIRP